MDTFAIFLSALLAATLIHVDGSRIDFPTIKYVKPGDGFDLICATDATDSGSGIVDAIYGPYEETPSDAELEAAARAKTDSAFTHVQGEYKKEYVEAQKEVHDGWYTCVVFYQGENVLDKARCLVIIEDLCEDVVCEGTQTCVADYDTGTSDCQCVEECSDNPLRNTLVCVDTCQLLLECEIPHRNCQDGLDRQIWKRGFCGFNDYEPIKPSLRLSPTTMKIEPDVGETVTLDCGIYQDGTPPLATTWSIDGIEDESAGNQHHYLVTVTPGMNTLYECKMVQCKSESMTNYNRFLIKTEGELGGGEPVYPVCSVYPGGVIEQFDTTPAFYDLACTHVLAADFGPGGDYTQSWYIYGTFDEHDGDIALSSMTVYAGRTAFEVQRGWLVNVDGEKFLLEEDVPRTYGDCEIMFSGLHVRVGCPHFNLFYDGVMAGHIQIFTPSGEGEGFTAEKSYTNIGLCWDNKSGFRQNWQLGSSRPSCALDPSLEECQEETASCSEYVQTTGIFQPDKPRGLGAEQSCNELHCAGDTPTPAQECALNQADSINAQLRLHSPADVTGPSPGLDGCPEEECVWKLDLVSRGCPQPNPPFQC